MKIRYTKYRKIYYIVSILLILGSVFAIFKFGLKPGIDFTGGSILEVQYKDARPSNDQIKGSLSGIDLGEYTLQTTGDKGEILKMKDISDDVHNQILSKLGKDQGTITETNFESIGPSIGNELKNKTTLLAFAALLAMVIYITIAFWKVQRPLKSWQYGLTSLIAVLHDVIIPLGIFALLGKYFGTEITIPVVTALLTFLGHSINNTVVVFDRVRENIFRGGGTFEEIVDKSLNQTLGRQINTSATVLLGVLALYFFGGNTLKDFALALILGVICATYSSFFISAPLLVTWLKSASKKQEKAKR